MPRLGDLFDVSAGASIRGKLPIDPDGNAFAIQQRDISLDGISATLERISYPKAERYRLEVGDVLLRSKGNPMLSAEFKSDIPAGLPVVAGGSVLVLKKCSTAIRPAYLSWLLNSHWGERMFARIRSEATIPVIAVRDLVELDVPLPSLENQDRICELASLVRRQEELAARYRQAIDNLLVARSTATDELTFL